jgi:hypothetical protein
MSSQTATVASVAASATSVQIFPQVWPVEAGTGTGSNGRVVYNDSTATLYLLFGTGATTTNYTVQIAAGGYFEFPAFPMFLGEVDGVWSSATGNARTTAW